ncbi:Sec-independent protein translocase subunit TatA [Actinomadura rayongensis]|jgi:sec-independent protein translocase protein TatA|uniref:Sec-independent protein translocase subunit TatA n=1 Tax=Actinomadura rayongensis TaxID=1429076 RepID=UPI00192897F2|nr:Sec-independent protein translocase subunit TatA [Actinomadura rayongensis]
MIGEFSPAHWLIVGLVVVLLVGSKKLPDTARALGRSMRILKAETRGIRADDDVPAVDPTPEDQRERAARLRAEAARLDAAEDPRAS